MSNRCICLGVLLAAFIGPGAAQIGRYPGSRNPGGTPPTFPGGKGKPGQTRKDKSDELLPTFNGTLKSISSTQLLLETDDSNTVQFHCSKKTRFYDGGKKVKASALKPGDTLAVEAKRAPDDSLDAVNVRVERPKS